MIVNLHVQSCEGCCVKLVRNAGTGDTSKIHSMVHHLIFIIWCLGHNLFIFIKKSALYDHHTCDDQRQMMIRGGIIKPRVRD